MCLESKEENRLKKAPLKEQGSLNHPEEWGTETSDAYKEAGQGLLCCCCILLPFLFKLVLTLLRTADT